MAVSKQFPIRLSEEDRETLDMIVAHYTLDGAASAVRWLIRQEGLRIKGTKPTMIPAPSSQVAPSADDAQGDADEWGYKP